MAIYATPTQPESTLMFGWLKRTFGSEKSSSAASSYGATSTAPEPSFTVPEESTNLSFVLLKGSPTEENLRETLIHAGLTIDEHDDAESSDEDAPLTFFASREGVTYMISHFPAPIPDGEAEAVAHPFFCDSDSIEGYDQHLIVAAMYSLSERSEPSTTEEAIAAISDHADVVAHLLGLPEAVGVYSGRVATTFDARSYRQAVLEDPFPPIFISPLWVNTDGTNMHFYSFGLKDVGLPDLQVIKRPSDNIDPNEIYGYLMDILAYILQGNRIHAGETLGRTAEEKFTTSWQPWVVDEEETALQIDLNL